MEFVYSLNQRFKLGAYIDYNALNAMVAHYYIYFLVTYYVDGFETKNYGGLTFF
jgi:hypothetical protein